MQAQFKRRCSGMTSGIWEASLHLFFFFPSPPFVLIIDHIPLRSLLISSHLSLPFFLVNGGQKSSQEVETRSRGRGRGMLTGEFGREERKERERNRYFHEKVSTGKTASYVLMCIMTYHAFSFYAFHAIVYTRALVILLVAIQIDAILQYILTLYSSLAK